MAGNGEAVLEELSNDGQAVHEVALLQNFLRGHPKTLGAVEIVIGGVLFMFGVELTIRAETKSAQSGFLLWGGLVFVSSGAVSITANTKLTEILVKASLGMNILCMASAVIGIVLFSLDLSFFLRPHLQLDPSMAMQMDSPLALYVNRSLAVIIVLLILSLTQLLIAIYVCVWAFKATCSTRHLPKIQFVSDPRGQNMSATENNTSHGQDSLVMINDHPHEQT